MNTHDSYPQEQWGLYIPPAAVAPFPEVLWPYQKIDMPDGNRPLLVVVSSAASLHATRELKAAYPKLPVVIWAWQLAEVLAAASEDVTPVVYGWPSHENVIAACERGPGRTSDTTLALECESAFLFPVQFELPEEYFYDVMAQG